MDTGILETVGKVAGIGGIALGVFLLLFRDVIRKSIFPQLTKAQAYSLLRLIVVLVFLVAIAGLGAWVWAANGGGREVNASGGSSAVGGDVNDSSITVNGKRSP
jgi:hypothetical protein